MIRFFDGTIVSNPGSRFRDIYSPIVKDTGEIVLEITGKEDFFAYIQSFREMCDFNYIMERIANGEIESIPTRSGFYADVTEMPKTYAEMLQLKINADNAFDRLSPDLKKKFDNDKNKFFAQAGTEEWFKNLGMIKDEPIKEESEVTVKE